MNNRGRAVSLHCCFRFDVPLCKNLHAEDTIYVMAFRPNYAHMILSLKKDEKTLLSLGHEKTFSKKFCPSISCQ